MKRMWSRNELVKQVKEVKKDVATLVDAQGHPRFIEGDITLNEVAGVSKLYGKWSLSGSHLLIVLCLEFADESVISNGVNFADIELPEWIYDKVAVVWSTDAIIRQSNVPLYADDWSTQSLTFLLAKANNYLTIYGLNNLTLTAKRKVRLAFDLLIDNE